MDKKKIKIKTTLIFIGFRMLNYLINYKKNIRDCLLKLEQNEQKCLIVINDKKQIVGTLTDGDIRRALLKNAILETKIINYVKKNPVSIKVKNSSISESEINEKIKNLIEIIKDDNIDLIPIIKPNKQILKIVSTKNFQKIIKKNNKLGNVPVLIMAGGEGRRLKQFTNYFPKPLLPFGNSTSIENIISRFKKYEIKKFYISVYYKKNLIKSYLKGNFHKDLIFLEEKQPLGTAGSIKLLKGKVKGDFFIINCDTILNINLEKFYEFHKKNNFNLTLVAASKNFQLSYGSCQINKNGQLKKIEEKPSINSLVSVGLYLAKPDIIKKISNKGIFQMDMLIKKIKNNGGKVGVFPIDENSWIDTGFLRE